MPWIEFFCEKFVIETFMRMNILTRRGVVILQFLNRLSVERCHY